MTRTAEDEIGYALNFISAADRETWIRMGMAIKNALGDQGFSLWNEWSKTAPNYQAHVMRTQWKSLRGHNPNGKSITVQSLFWTASQNGYVNDGKFKMQRSAVRHAPVRDPGPTPEELAVKVRKVLNTCELQTHPYFCAKGFPDHQVLVDKADRAVIPIYLWGHRKRPMSAQAIDQHGNKHFMKHMPVRNGCHDMGPPARSRIVCEGVATALTILQALTTMRITAPVRIAFAAANVPKLTGLDDLVVIDHDRWTCRNTDCKNKWDAPGMFQWCPKCGDVKPAPPAGRKYGERIRSSTPYVEPPDVGDLNDVHVAHGIDAVCDILRQGLRNWKR